jgi:hypothetical protein
VSALKERLAGERRTSRRERQMCRKSGLFNWKAVLVTGTILFLLMPIELTAQLEGTAADYYADAEGLAVAWQSNAELVRMAGVGEGLWEDGKAPAWMYHFSSDSVDSLLWVIVTLGFPVSEVVNDTIGILGGIPDGWVDSDVATSVAEENGGSEFRNSTGNNFSVTTAGRGLYLQEILRPVWMIAYTDTSLVSLIIYVDAATGEYLDSHTVSVGDRPDFGQEFPRAFNLSQNYPNPFNPSTTLKYAIPAGKAGSIKVGVYDLRGRRVKTLYEGVREPGVYEVHWDGKNDLGVAVGGGLYLAKLITGGEILIRKMTLVK